MASARGKRPSALVGVCDLLAGLGVLVFLFAGPFVALAFDWPGAPHRGRWWESGAFGPFFVPSLLLALVAPDAFAASRVGRAARRTWSWARGLSTRARHALLVGTVLVLGAFQLATIVNRYLSYRAAMDLAIYANACRGALHSTIKSDGSLLADHFEPLLLLLTPLCRSVDPPLALLSAGIVAWCIGALGAFRLARALRWSWATSFVGAALYMQFTGFASLVHYDFHLDQLMIGLVPWLWLALVRRRFALVWALALLSLGLKESAALSLVGFGAFLVLSPGRDEPGARQKRLHGIAFVLVGATAFFVIMKFVYPHYRSGSQNFYFEKYYSHLGHDLPSFVNTAFTRPIYFVSTFLTGPKVVYVVLLLLPFAFVPLLRPSVLSAIAPALFINVASKDPHMFSGDYHYEAEILPTLFVATIVLTRDPITLARARRLFASFRRPPVPSRARPVGLRFLVLAVLLVGASGGGPLWLPLELRPRSEHAYLDRKLGELVPRDAKIAANQKVATHLTSHPNLYIFDYWAMEDDWKKADLIVVAAPAADLGWYDLDWIHARVPLFEEAGFVLQYQDPQYPEFKIWQRRSPGH